MTSERETLHIEHMQSKRVGRQELKGLWWGVTLLWAGLIFGADSLGLLPQIGASTSWSWIFAGAGIVGLLGAVYRVVASDVPDPTTWDWIWAGFCLIVGLGGFTALRISWPLILIVAGFVLLFRVFL